MLPFTVGQFFAVFADYNNAIWPAPVIAYLIGGAVAAAALTTAWPLLELTALAILWAWTGLIYQILFFSRINNAAYGFGAIFLIQAGVLIAHALHGAGPPGPRRSALSTAAGVALIVYAMLLYPLFGWLAGHRYPAVPLFGVTPCPLTIFTFGMLLLIGAARRRWLAAIPLIWSVIGGTAAVMLAVPQDAMLPVAALLFLAIGSAERRWVLTSPPNTRHPPGSPRR